MLEVSSTQSPFLGFLMPRLTTANRDLMLLPATGLMIFNITNNRVEINTGTPAAPNLLQVIHKKQVQSFKVLYTR